MAGGFNPKGFIINLMLDRPVACYLGGASALYAYRWYQTKTTYNFWFGKIEYDRKLERNQL